MRKTITLLTAILMLFLFYGCDEKDQNTIADVPVKGMVTMVDLGADKCVPCKLMAPILEELKKDYHDRAAIVFIDVWKDKAPAKRFGIKAIPTQIFFDSEGNEVYRHIGFMSKEDITGRLEQMGVE